MNPFTLISADISLIRLKLKRPFTTALGRKTETTNAVISIRLKSGAQGRGEASSSVVWADTSPTRLASTLRRLAKSFHGRDARELASEIWKLGGNVPPAASAFECAIAAAIAQTSNTDLWHLCGGAQNRLTTNITLSAAPPAMTRASAREAAAEGFRTLKIKVGTRGDFERVAAAHAAAGNPRIILDGNQKLGLTKSLRLVERCLKRGMKIILLEQPVASDNLKAFLECARLCPVPVAADESLRSADDARRIIDSGVRAAFNIKLSKTGFEQSLRIASLGRAAGTPLMIGCMQESSAGLGPSASLAAGTGWFSFVDLDSDHLLEHSPQGPFKRSGPVLIRQ